MSANVARWMRLICCGLGLVVAAPALARDKTDVVLLQNGDRVTGEIIRLDHGRLEVKTDALGTVYIDWPKISSVSSPIVFMVETLNGRKHYGSLAPSASGMGVVEQQETIDLPLEQVAALGPVRNTFLARVRGSASVGANFTKSSALSASSFRFNAEYEGRRTLASLATSADLSSSDGTHTSQRLTVDYSQRFFLEGTRFWSALASFERMQQLGVDGRVQVGLAAGQSLFRTADHDIVAFAGVAASEEQEKDTGATD